MKITSGIDEHFTFRLFNDKMISKMLLLLLIFSVHKSIWCCVTCFLCPWLAYILLFYQPNVCVCSCMGINENLSVCVWLGEKSDLMCPSPPIFIPVNKWVLLCIVAIKSTTKQSNQAISFYLVVFLLLLFLISLFFDFLSIVAAITIILAHRCFDMMCLTKLTL